MNDAPENSQAEKATIPDTAQESENTVYTYTSAGVAERQGNVPIWLWVVMISLVIWGLYYLVVYWNAPLVQL